MQGFLTLLAPKSKKIRITIFSQNTQNCFAYNSATKYRSEAVLYAKRTAGYPLSPHIKTITVAFLQAEIQRQQGCCILENSKKQPTLGVWCAPPNFFSEFVFSNYDFY